MTSRETERLLLRQPSLADLDPYVEIHEDPEVMRYLVSIGQSSGRIAAWRMIALLMGHWQLLGYGQWTVVERVSREVVGRVGLWNPEGWPGLEVGWVIRRACWGRGYATEAARAAVDYAFDVVGADHLISQIHPDNERSIRVATKIGETFEREDRLGGQVVHVYGMRRYGGRE
jgi:RimJ/RimL family protein N-acetyltransferase